MTAGQTKAEKREAHPTYGWASPRTRHGVVRVSDLLGLLYCFSQEKTTSETREGKKHHY